MTPQVSRAIELACVAHHGQFRKGGQRDIPYISHPFAVAMLVRESTDDEDCFIAALLHDVIEDCVAIYSRQVNPQMFSEEVYRIVTSVTDTRPVGMNYRDRKINFIEQIIAGGPKAVLISACDKIHNMTCLLENLNLRRETGTRPVADLIWYWEYFINYAPVHPFQAVPYRQVLAQICHWAHDELAKAPKA